MSETERLWDILRKLNIVEASIGVNPQHNQPSLAQILWKVQESIGVDPQHFQISIAQMLGNIILTLDQIQKTQTDMGQKLDTILNMLTEHTTETAQIVFVGGNNMLTLPLGDQDQGWFQVTVDPGDGTGPALVDTLPSGQTLGTLVSDDTGTVTIAWDSPAVPNPDGTKSVGSFTVKSVTPPNAPNKEIAIHATILNSDLTPFSTTDGSVTVSLTAKESSGFVFGTPTVIPPAPAPAKRK